MGTAKLFWNWMADRYSRQPIADEASYQKKLAITQRYLTADMEVVEFGCGTGSTAVVHAPKVARYLGIDVSEKMVEIGRGKAREADLSNLTFEVGTLEDVAAPDGGCDAILALNILHLLPDLDATLTTVSRRLKPGGVFISSTICLSELRGQLQWIARAVSWLPLLPTVAPFKAAELVDKLERTGFRIEERFEPRAGVLFLVAIQPESGAPATP